jgi:hypothetical protein
MFLDHTQRRTTVGRTTLDEWSDRRRDFYLKTRDTHNRQISMPPVGFEPKILAGDARSPAKILDEGARGSAVAWGTVQQLERSRVRFPMVSLEFFFNMILPAALWPLGWLSL